jgi:hypothetical protein
MKKIEIYYAPFEYVNEQAIVVIVGITPGFHQMKKSYLTVRHLKHKMINDEKILQEVNKNSSFEGTILITMLDELQLHRYLGLASTRELFDTGSHIAFRKRVSL